MRYYIYLEKHYFAIAPEKEDRIAWEVSLKSPDGHTLSTQLVAQTSFYNYDPLTRDDQIEREARQLAESLAKKLGIPVLERR